MSSPPTAARSDAAAWDLVVGHEPHLARLARHVARSSRGADPDELASVARPKVFTAAQRFDEALGPKFWSYARVGARFAMLDFLDEYHRGSEVTFSRLAGDDGDDGPQATDLYADPRADDPSARLAAVDAVLGHLPPKQRDAVLAMSGAGRSARVVAGGRSTSTVRTNCARGLRAIRKQMGSDLRASPTRLRAGDMARRRSPLGSERTRRGETLAQLARAIGTTGHVVAGWESGLHRPYPSFVARLATHYGRPVEEVSGWFGSTRSSRSDLAAARVARGLSQPALAAAIGLSVSCLRTWEAGQVTFPRTTRLRALAEKLGRPLAEVAGWFAATPATSDHLLPHSPAEAPRVRSVNQNYVFG